MNLLLKKDVIGESQHGVWARRVPEFWHGFHEMRTNEVCDPFGRFLAELSLEFNFQDSIPIRTEFQTTKETEEGKGGLEYFLVIIRDLGKGKVNSDVSSSPIIARPDAAIPIILTE